jgi:chitinase
MALAVPAPYFTSPTGKQAVYYHCSWSCYDRKFYPRNLPIEKITDIAYAFFNVDATGRVFSGDEWSDYLMPFNGHGEGIDPQNTWDSPPEQLGTLGQFLKLRKQGHKFNMHASVGGWSWSGNFSPAIQNAENRERFVVSLAAIMNRYPGLFNGISLDWEYMSDNGVNYGLGGNRTNKNDPANFMELLKLIREKLPGFKVSMCTAAAPEKLKFPVKKVSKLVDEVHVMTYDFMDGSWGQGGPASGHHTNLSKSPFVPYSTEVATETMLKLGVEPKKIFIGVAFYSRGFGNTDGLGKPYTSGSTDKTWDAGSVDYKRLPLPGAKEMWDPVANAAYSYDPKKRVLNSYDEPRSVKLKCDYVHAKGLGGILVWENSADHPYDHPRSLVRVIHDHLTHGGGNKPDPPTPKPPTPDPPTPDPPTPPTPKPTPPTPKPTPKPKPTPPTPPTPDGMWGNDGEPFFYNGAVKMKCPAGLVWDSSSTTCNWPKK